MHTLSAVTTDLSWGLQNVSGMSPPIQVDQTAGSTRVGWIDSNLLSAFDSEEGTHT